MCLCVQGCPQANNTAWAYQLCGGDCPRGIYCTPLHAKEPAVHGSSHHHRWRHLGYGAGNHSRVHLCVRVRVFSSLYFDCLPPACFSSCLLGLCKLTVCLPLSAFWSLTPRDVRSNELLRRLWPRPLYRSPLSLWAWGTRISGRWKSWMRMKCL